MTTVSLSEKVAALIDIISHEGSVLEDFLGLLERHQESLAGNDVEGLNRLNELQREKLVESQLLNRQRDALISEIKSANATEGDLNVSRLVRLVDENQGNLLLNLKGVITGLNTCINDIKIQNASLLNRSREYIARTRQLLSDIKSPKANYTRNAPSATRGTDAKVIMTADGPRVKTIVKKTIVGR